MTRPLDARLIDTATRWRGGTAALGAATLGCVLALWLDGGGPAGQPAVSAGRLAGLLSANLLLLQVFTMARVPWLERAWGQDRLARWHRWTGFASLWLMLAHIVLTSVGYAATAAVGPVRRFGQLVLTYPGMLLAAAGAGLLVAVAGLSVRAARRRLRYESWHLLHLYAYLGIGLALPHQLWNGTEFVTSAVARVFWWTLYLGAAGSVLLFRLFLPWWRSRRHRLRVAEVRHEASDVYSVYLTGRRLERLAARPGQFLLWRLRTGPGWTRAHPFSLSEAPRPDRLRFTFRAGGDDGARLAAAAVGTAVLVEGPFGTLTEARRRGTGVLLMAAGIGITPMRALLEGLGDGVGELTLIYRARSEDELVLRGELDEIAARRGARVIYLPGPPPPGRASWRAADPAGPSSDHEALRELVPDVGDRDVYLCGPPPWMAVARRALRAAGVPDRRIHTERFGW